jgi:hypothetical protein
MPRFFSSGLKQGWLQQANEMGWVDRKWTA